MRTTLLRGALMLFAAAFLAGQSLDWREYKNSAGNFSAQMPAEPEDTNASEGVDIHTILAFVDGVGYTVAYANSSEDQPVNHAIFKRYAEGMIKSSNCTVVDEAPASPAIPHLIGRHYRLDCGTGSEKLTDVGNLYLAKHYTYAVLVMFPPRPVDPPNIKKFVDSFALIDPAK
jgi:hypothetical protein